MSWLQLTLTVSRPQAPAAELLFESLGALSVTYADAEDQPLLEPGPGETPLWTQSRITALFDADADAESLDRAIRQALPGEVADTLQHQVLQDQAWERAWMENFHPMRFGRRLWICPDGQKPPMEDAVVVDLDPGLAFGTGTHPTTALCLHWLDGADLAGRRVLDYGCGSGILALAAARLGASRVDAVDHDPQALQATRENAHKNRVSGLVRAYTPAELPEATYDVLLANILAGALEELATEFRKRVRPGGALLLSGILQNQEARMINAYAPLFRFQKAQKEQDWVMLHGVREFD